MCLSEMDGQKQYEIDHCYYSRELVLTDNEDRLVDLPSQDLWLDQGDGLSVDSEQTLALLGVCDGCRRLLLSEG